MTTFQRTNALITKARQAQSREMAVLEQMRTTLRELDAQQFQLSARQALLVGCRPTPPLAGEYRAGDLTRQIVSSEHTWRRFSAFAQEAVQIERAREQTIRKIREIQQRVATASRLVDYLSTTR